ncbi:N,N-dimethylformamidase beta subunit family domain-containing protein [Georgenia sp. SYP-B2076]|uniref:N,N-dimethylformamidase beta subunit family domain-containing protein n=1 Tax=Georgenia sp. SYP-B2076 TaxID=2495881 RepID=UPI00197AC27C|nr:N,N-dimethylformamidase beta subunit family domain-containing protein [Georgenia sp. SYP-B2076]
MSIENGQPGTPGWQISQPGRPGEIEGYADSVSARPGQRVRLFVSTTATGFRAEAFRVGWYSGVGARRLWSSPHVPGRRQAPAVTVGSTRTASAPWQPSLTLPTSRWTPGDYVVRLTSDSGGQTYVPLTLRTPDAAGRVMILNAVTTWQAYNRWGGRSLYAGPGGFTDRSYAVSFDRPYDDNVGTGLFLADELPAVRLAERLGLNLGYLTDVDLDRDPAAVQGARAVISLGHDEYWSSTMRDRLTAARDAGTNIAFLGANAVYRHIRFAGTSTGDRRLQIDYKEPRLDPLLGKNDAEVTADWPSGPRPRPQSDLTGTFYECNPVRAPMVVTDAPGWLFGGSGAGPDTTLTDLVGSEYDRVNTAVPTPRPIQILAHSPVTCRGRHSHADMAYYSAPSGAGVLDVGTNMWVRALDDGAGSGPDAARNDAIVSQVTTNLLRTFAAGPAGRARPAVDNVALEGSATPSR